MNILTEHEIDIFCLPETAYCKAGKDNPENMAVCPLHRFDDFGSVCKPDLCEEYTEDCV